jgi:hypothetical protein
VILARREPEGAGQDGVLQAASGTALLRSETAEASCRAALRAGRWPLQLFRGPCGDVVLRETSILAK